MVPCVVAAEAASPTPPNQSVRNSSRVRKRLIPIQVTVSTTLDTQTSRIAYQPALELYVTMCWLEGVFVVLLFLGH